MYCLHAEESMPLNLPINAHLPTYSAGVGDWARGASTGASTVSGAILGALPSDNVPPSTSTPALALTNAETGVGMGSGSGEVVRSMAACDRPSSDSGGRTPPRRRRGVTRRLCRSAGGGGGRASSVLLGSHERNVRWDRVSGCVDADPGAGLDRALGVATVPVPIPELVLVVLVLALSGTGLHGSSGRRDGKNRRGGTLVVFGERRGDVVIDTAGSSGSGSTLGTMPLPSRPDERRRDVKSVKSTVRGRAGMRRMEGWRVSGGADGAVGDGGPHPSGEVSRRSTQSSRRVAERSI